MLLDPFTIIAQILNFAILVWALKRFLYDRVIAAMDERESRIAAQLHDAEEREAAAARSSSEFEQRRVELESRQRDLLDEAKAEAEEHRRRLLEQARIDVATQRDRWERALDTEQREVERELRRRTAREVVEISRQALSDLAGADLESAVIELALQHLVADDASHAALLADVGPGEPLVVRTAFALSDARRSDITRRLHAIGLSADHPVRFERKEHLLLGVEFDGSGTAVSWHAHDYLERLDASVQELIESTDLGSNVG